jgi:probable F420-dependent oxidoreductase
MAASIVPPGALAYGIQLPIQTLTRTLREPWEFDAGVDDLVGVAKAADDAGFWFLGFTDHVALPHNDYTQNMTTTWYDPIATMGFVAANTENIRLLSSVYIAAYRHPLVSAKSFLTLDHLSGGRLIVGIGAGHVESEFEALGIDFASRGARTNEAIDAMRRALAAEYSSFDGEFFRYADVGLSPRPANGDGAIPIWIGGSSRPALRRAAEHGDGWIPQGTPRERMRGCIDYLRAHRDKARPGEPIDIGFHPPWLYVGEPGWDTGENTVTGAPHKLAATLRETRELGANVMHLHFRSRGRTELCDQLAAFGRDVAPLLAQQ